MEVKRFNFFPELQCGRHTCHMEPDLDGEYVSSRDYERLEIIKKELLSALTEAEGWTTRPSALWKGSAVEAECAAMHKRVEAAIKQAKS